MSETEEQANEAKALEASPDTPETWVPESRRARIAAAIAMLLGYGGAFLLMTSAEQLARGPLYGILLTLVGTFGFVVLVDGPRRVPLTPLYASPFAREEGEPWWMAPRATLPLSALLFLALFFGLRGARGFDEAVGIAVLAALAPLLLSAFRRPSLLLALIVTGIYLPRLGAYPLWDPWETHYGEVSREILSRDDWISLWWAQDGWFWSKPILIFWAEALSMGAFGVNALPDASPSDPEWALRFPIFLMSLGAVLAVNALARRLAGARAGVLAGLVVASMPFFFMISHQAITDMPVVSCMTIALCLLGLAVVTKPEARFAEYALGPFRVSARRFALGALALVGVPQILYLLSRNLLRQGARFTPRSDWFLLGSAGNDGVPGNEALRELGPVYDALALQPAAQALWWTALLALVIALVRRDDKQQGPLMVGFYILSALGFLAKGIPGFALPGLVALFFLIATSRFKSLLHGELRVSSGVLIVLALGLPWYVAMYIRHGVAFIDRILIHDHVNRLAVGVHGDTGSMSYFVSQLGYGTFPWVALAPAAVLAFAWYGRAKPRSDGERAQDATWDGVVLVVIWALASFTLFSAMVTKFHHYIFPVVPPTGILVGVVLASLVPPAKRARDEALASLLGVLGGGLLVLAFGSLHGDLRGLVPRSVEASAHADWVLSHGPSAWVSALLFALALGALGACHHLTRREEDDARAPAGVALIAFGGGALAALVGRDLSWATSTRPAGYERIANLYTYQYHRSWPTHLDYRPFLTGLAIAATIAIVALAWTKLRAVAARALLGTALAFAIFGVNVYLPDVAPQWSSGGLVGRYYALRKEGEPLLAFQMNWKGENFYTGNRVHVFADLNLAKLSAWLTANDRTSFYAILEPTRLASFRGAIGVRQAREVTDTRFNNKFVLVYVPSSY